MPEKTALVVIDMQNYFVEPPYLGWVPMAKSIVPNINALAAAIRDRRGHVVWVRNTTSGTENNWSVMHRYLLSPEKSEIRLRTMAKDHHGFEFYSDMDIRDGDGILAKTKYSAFIQGSSGLTEYLKDRGIDAVLIAGTATNVCCESTARDAMMLNFKTVMVDDCLAAYSDKEHSASLSSFYAMFGDVQSYRQTIAFLDRGVEARAWSENCSG
jgi:nicotinamidase-related amidase